MEFKVYLQQSSFIQTEFTLHSYSAQLILWMVNNRNWRAAHSWVGEHWFEFATDGFYHHGWWATAPQRRSLVMIVTTTRTMMISQWWNLWANFYRFSKTLWTFCIAGGSQDLANLCTATSLVNCSGGFHFWVAGLAFSPLSQPIWPTWPAMYSWKHFESVKLPLRHFLVVIIVTFIRSYL